MSLDIAEAAGDAVAFTVDGASVGLPAELLVAQADANANTNATDAALAA